MNTSDELLNKLLDILKDIDHKLTDIKYQLDDINYQLSGIKRILDRSYYPASYNPIYYPVYTTFTSSNTLNKDLYYGDKDE